MWNRCLMLFSTFLCVAGLSACGLPVASAAADGNGSASDTLTAYRSEAELNQALARWRSLAGQQRAERRQLGDVGGTLAFNSAAPAAAPAALAKSEVAAGAAAESITNVQTAGVDEGGIVKRAGEHLVILRRGRLFTVRVGGDPLQPLAMLDAYAPGSNPQGAWYDELLISGSTVVVVGYSYARGGTEIGLFDLGDERFAGLPCHLPPAQFRLLLVAQLREPADRQQAGLLHAHSAAPLGAVVGADAARRAPLAG